MLAVFILVVGVVGWRLRGTTQSSSQPVYFSAKVRQGTLTETVSETGTLAPYSVTPVRAVTGGQISGRLPQVGDQVKVGQLILHLQSPTLTAQITQDKLNVAKLQDQLKIASGATISPTLLQQINDQEVTIAQDEATLNADQAALSGQNVNAPQAGSVQAINVTVGQNVSSGQTVLTLVTPDVLQLSGITTGNIDGLTIGTPATITMGNGQHTTGTVSSFSTASQKVGGASGYPVTFSIKNPGFISPGEFATAWVKTDSANFTVQAYVQANNPVTVTAPLSGTVESLAVNVGTQVHVNDPLLTVTSTAAQQKVITDQVTLGQAKRQMDTLMAQDKQTSVQNQQTVTLDQNALQSAQDALQSDQKALHDLDVYSPVAGVITNVPTAVQPGAPIAQGTDISDVADLTKLQLQVPIVQSQINDIKVGQQAQITSTGVPGTTFTGTVTSISVIGSSSNGITSFPVTITIDKPGALKPGMTATADLTVAQVQSALIVPNTAIRTDNSGRPYVLTLVGGSPHQTPVTLGLQTASDAQVIHGLTAGQSVVLAGAPQTATSGNTRGGRGLGGGGFLRRGGGG